MVLERGLGVGRGISSIIGRVWGGGGGGWKGHREGLGVGAGEGIGRV